MKKILVIDNDDGHLKNGLEIVKAAGLEQVGRGSQMFYGLPNWLEELAAEGEVGVLTDLYFRHDPPNPYLPPPHGEEAPLGLLVMAECRRLGIPCVIVTAGYHHGSKYHEVCMALRVLGWPDMVDSLTPALGAEEEEAKEKNWAEGLKRLLEIAEQKSGAG